MNRKPLKMKNIIPLLTGLLATVLLSACALYGKYERPEEINTTGIVRDTSAASATTADTLVVTDKSSFGDIPWQQVFTDPQLQGLIQRALVNNVDLRNAALNVEMVEKQLVVSKLAFVPGFTFTPNGALTQWNGGTWNKTYSLPVNASWTVDLFGNLLSQKRSVQMKLLAMKDYQQSVRCNIIASTANLYYTLLMLDKQLELVTEMNTLTKDTWDYMKLQKDLGRTKETSVVSAEANYYSVQAQAADLRRQIRETENSLSVLLGMPAQTIQRGKIEDQSLPTQFSTGVGLALLDNRPDVHAAEMSLAQCFYDVETARSNFFPNITISGSAAFTNNSGAGIVNPGKWLLSAAGSLTQPIFQHGMLTANLKVAKMQYEQALNTYQNTIYKAGSEVSNALVLYNTSAEKSELEQKQIDALSKSVEYTKDLLAMGGASYIEVITSQQQLLNAELSKVADDFYKMQAIVNLYSALGGGKE
jgi:NodT family efflux transporter outer membrane factor (OMF) lipoprotein